MLQLSEIVSYIVSFCPPGRIKDVLAQGVLDSMTRLVLVNAIYFKGNWNQRFDEYDTCDAQFRINQVTLLKWNIQYTYSHWQSQLKLENMGFKIVV